MLVRNTFLDISNNPPEIEPLTLFRCKTAPAAGGKRIDLHAAEDDLSSNSSSTDDGADLEVPSRVDAVLGLPGAHLLPDKLELHMPAVVKVCPMQTDELSCRQQPPYRQQPPRQINEVAKRAGVVFPPGPLQPGIQPNITKVSLAAAEKANVGSLSSGGIQASRQPQTLSIAFSKTSQSYLVRWIVDGQKLHSNDKLAVSPPFDLSLARDYSEVRFKMMICPETQNEGKGGSCFRKSGGRGFVQLKCEAELPCAISSMSFTIGVGNGGSIQETRGPAEHDFTSSAVCGLPKAQEIWDFQKYEDKGSQTFVICLELKQLVRLELKQRSKERRRVRLSNMVPHPSLSSNNYS